MPFGRFLFPVVLGIGGVAVLASLGAWQLQRLEWKETVLAEMDARLTGVPVALAEASDPYVRFAAVRVVGSTTGEELHVLHPTGQGAGYRLISAFETGEGRILLDEGLIAGEAKDRPRPPRNLVVVGNLHIPDDWTGSTPEPDLAKNIWYGRDLDRMAEALDARPVYVVTRRIEAGEAVAEPLPLDTSGIANNHLGYAVQWFGLALVWAGMTGYWLWRKRRGTPREDA
jgi:surfeit locus 1 family protein